MKQLKKELSPVQNASHLDPKKNYPEFLILTGESDSRVNREHSLQFYQTLKANPDFKSQVSMVLTPFAGHFSYSPMHQKAVGIATRAMMWTRIYDYLGLKMY